MLSSRIPHPPSRITYLLSQIPHPVSPIPFIFAKSNNSLPSTPFIHTIGQPFIELNEIDSTNIYAVDKLHAKLAAHGTAFFAHHQTAGKGQWGKAWDTEPGANILMSIIFDTSFLSSAQQFPLSMMAALAAHDLFSNYAMEETTIKWPNDIYWRDRKAGGLLIENVGGMRDTGYGMRDAGYGMRDGGYKMKWSVIGLGININQTSFPEHLRNPVSLKQITGKDYDTIALAKELCGYMGKRYLKLLEGLKPSKSLIKNKPSKGLEPLEGFKEYNQKLYKLRQPVRLKKDTAIFSCIIEGVNERGELLVSGAAKDHYTFGEVEWVIG